MLNFLKYSLFLSTILALNLTQQDLNIQSSMAAFNSNIEDII